MSSKSKVDKSKREAKIDITQVFRVPELMEGKRLKVPIEADEDFNKELEEKADSKEEYDALLAICNAQSIDELITAARSYHNTMNLKAIHQGAEKGRKKTASKADEFALTLKPYFEKAKENGCHTLREKAEFLNKAGARTYDGEKFTAKTVSRNEGYIRRQGFDI